MTVPSGGPCCKHQEIWGLNRPVKRYVCICKINKRVYMIVLIKKHYESISSR